MKFILPIPPSINATYGVSGFNYKNNSRMYKKAIATDWENKAGWELKLQINKMGMSKRLPLISNIKINVDYFYLKNRDWDAGNKILCDLLEKMQVYKNDMQIVEACVRKFADPGDPRVEIEVLSV